MYARLPGRQYSQTTALLQGQSLSLAQTHGAMDLLLHAELSIWAVVALRPWLHILLDSQEWLQRVRVADLAPHAMAVLAAASVHAPHLARYSRQLDPAVLLTKHILSERWCTVELSGLAQVESFEHGTCLPIHVTFSACHVEGLTCS